MSLAVGKDPRKLQEEEADGNEASYGVEGIHVSREGENDEAVEPTSGGGFPVMIVVVAAVGFVVASLFVVVLAKRKFRRREDVGDVKEGEDVFNGQEKNLA